MKQTFLILFLFIFIKGFAQNIPIDSTTHLITYSGVIQVDGNQNELYSRAREWFAKTYNSAQSVIQMDSKDKIVGKALMQVRALYGYFNYTISVYFKDGRYKYEVSNFYHTGQYVDGIRVPDYGTCEEMMHANHQRKVFNKAINQVNDNINSLVSSLKESMSKQVVKKDDF